MTSKPPDKAVRRRRKSARHATAVCSEIVLPHSNRLSAAPAITVEVVPPPDAVNPTPFDLDQVLYAKIVRSLRAGRLIEAVMLCRRTTKLSLNDAAGLVDHIRTTELATRH